MSCSLRSIRSRTPGSILPPLAALILLLLAAGCTTSQLVGFGSDDDSPNFDTPDREPSADAEEEPAPEEEPAETDASKPDGDAEESPSEREELPEEPDGDASTETDPPLPFVRGLDVTAISARNVLLAWPALSDEIEVVIARAPEGSDSFDEVARRRGGRGAFLDLGRTPLAGYRYRVTACSARGCGDTQVTPVIRMPESVLPEITIPVFPDPSKVSDDWLVFNTAKRTDNYMEVGHMVAVDRNGKVWWELHETERGVVTEIQPLPDHTLAVGKFMNLEIQDLDGAVVYRHSENTSHHDIDLLSGNRLLYLFFDPFPDPGNPARTILGDGIEILNRADWNPLWSWRLRDHIPLSDQSWADMQVNFAGIGQDWTHANALFFDEEESRIYLNVRNLNRIYKIAYPSGTIEWIMGDGGDFGEGLWSHSHDPQYFPRENRVLIFDNGLLRSDLSSHSRVIEVQYDPAAKTAEIVWEYREDPDFFSPVFGGTFLTPEGHIFFTAGSCVDLSDPLNGLARGRLVEVTREKEIVWELNIAPGHYIYKASLVPKTFFTEW